MKYHIVQIGEDISKICQIYGMERETLEKLNPTINSRNLIVGEKIRILVKEDKKILDDISSIYTNDKKDEEQEEKYICPHCKNIIIIPRK